MRNPFKELETNKDVSPEVKKRLLSEIASLTLASEFADLFTSKFASIFEGIFSSKKKK